MSPSCPTLSELPPPPTGKTGWPWTEESPRLPSTMPDGSSWPQISIVTPSYNQGQFIEETIRSVLLQGYPKLEYLVIDGGSTDDSVEIIRKYAQWLTYWISEPDQGQSDAINKGFTYAQGEITAWLNSDDTYWPEALGQVAQAFGQDQSKVVVHGRYNVIDERSHFIKTAEPYHITFKNLLRYWRRGVAQPATFFRRIVLQQVGLLNCDLHFAMDYDLFLRIAREHKFHRIEHVLANARFHPASKTSQEWPAAFYIEADAISRSYWGPKTSWQYTFLTLDRAIGMLRRRLGIGTKLRAGLNWSRRMFALASSNNKTRADEV